MNWSGELLLENQSIFQNESKPYPLPGPGAGQESRLKSAFEIRTPAFISAMQMRKANDTSHIRTAAEDHPSIPLAIANALGFSQPLNRSEYNCQNSQRPMEKGRHLCGMNCSGSPIG